MSQLNFKNGDERCVDLAIAKATIGLDAAESAEFERILMIPGNRKLAEEIELSITAADRAYGADTDITENNEPLSPAVRDQILIAAGEFFKRDSPDRQLQSKTRFRWREAIALTVAAASLALLLSGVNPLGKSDPLRSPETELTVEQKFEEFQSQPPTDMIELDWQPILTPEVTGKIVWSDLEQTGFMVFENLNINDASVEQYQLWIFDSDKAQAYPVDGGVFDITTDGKSIVPIKSHIPVSRAVQFAVTIEPPGGVTVSNRERIPVLAMIP